MEIPIRNIFYLLSYAYLKLRPDSEVDVGAESLRNMLNLMARVLIPATRDVMQRGWDHAYVPRTGVLSAVRGQLDIVPSLRRNLLRTGRVQCRYDEFSIDVLPNQILKSAIGLLLRTRYVDKVKEELAAEYRQKLLAYYQRMGGISEIVLKARHFHAVRLHRNNQHFELPLGICQLLWENIIPAEEGTVYRFRNFAKDKSKMAHLFEKFIYRFYLAHFGHQFESIKPQQVIQWKVTNVGVGVRERLPEMKTDLLLDDSRRKIILDAKFYRNPFSKGNGNIKPAHLYQLLAYLKNQEDPSRAATMSCEGILLYANSHQSAHMDFELDGHPIRIRTVDLNRPFEEIERDLLAVIG